MDVDRWRPGTAPLRPRPSYPSVAVLPQKDGTVSVLPLDGRRLAVPSRPLLFRTDGTVENTAHEAQLYKSKHCHIISLCSQLHAQRLHSHSHVEICSDCSLEEEAASLLSFSPNEPSLEDFMDSSLLPYFSVPSLYSSTWYCQIYTWKSNFIILLANCSSIQPQSSGPSMHRSRPSLVSWNYSH